MLLHFCHKKSPADNLQGFLHQRLTDAYQLRIFLKSYSPGFATYAFAAS